jgi:hypothetical protein
MKWGHGEVRRSALFWQLVRENTTRSFLVTADSLRDGGLIKALSAIWCPGMRISRSQNTINFSFELSTEQPDGL